MIKIDKLGLNIKKFRNEKKLSLKELAEEIDVSLSMLSQIESGKANPSLNTLKLISKSPTLSPITDSFGANDTFFPLTWVFGKHTKENKTVPIIYIPTTIPPIVINTLFDFLFVSLLIIINTS